ncbi:MAG TPA: ACP phosphodiesterase [Saprospiraceae bacterium]|nr:ACP phosphodiesterase [Saprospiraceae bacterium]
MNHLAHCLLSFGDAETLIGNFIGDHVKGRRWQLYPPGIQRGILLHRAIDAFTDQHPMVEQSVRRVRPFAGRWSPPVVDILYDHLLAGHWAEHATQPFDLFAQEVYTQLLHGAAHLPPVLQERLPRMVEGRFLHGYRSREGLDWVLGRFSQRLPAGLDVAALSDFFFQNLGAFEADFAAFFPDLWEEARRVWG